MSPAPSALLYKAWLETRGRFLFATGLAALIVVLAVLRAPSTLDVLSQGGRAMGYGEYLWLSTFGGYLQAIWVIAAVLLGLGGLLRERAAGSSTFTLGLPVARWTHVAARTLVAVAELAVMGVLPAVLAAALSGATGAPFPLGEALRFGVALVGGGLVFFGWGLLVAHIVQGEFAAPAVALVVVAAAFFVMKTPALTPFNVFNVMSGAGHLDDRTYFFEAPFPWRPLVVCTGLGLAMSAAAVAAIARREF